MWRQARLNTQLFQTFEVELGALRKWLHDWLNQQEQYVKDEPSQHLPDAANTCQTHIPVLCDAGCGGMERLGLDLNEEAIDHYRVAGAVTGGRGGGGRGR
jgi:hypothetical protein